jgi:phage terminase Nu1 subunit (DNA packaging protein)
MNKISDLKITSQIFSELLGVSRRTVESWKKEGMPHSKRGIPFEQAFGWWRLERFKELDELRAARTRRETAKARIAELEAQEKEESLIPREQSILWLSMIVSEAKSHFWGLPKRLSASLAVISDEKEIEEIMRKEIRRILEDLARPLKDRKKGSPRPLKK